MVLWWGRWSDCRSYSKFGISWTMEGILLRSNQIGKARKWIVSVTNSQCRLCNTQRTHHGPLSLCNGSRGHAGCGRLARRGWTVLTSIARAHWECMSEYEDRMIQLVYVTSVQLSHILSDFTGTHATYLCRLQNKKFEMVGHFSNSSWIWLAVCTKWMHHAEIDWPL